MAASGPGGPRDILAGLAASDAPGLAETALILGELEGDGADIRARCLAELDHWAAEAARAAPADSLGRARHLAEVLVVGAGLHADCHDEDLELSLARVMLRRRGQPEALGVIWLEVARRAGWEADGLAFPAHFLVRLADGAGGRAIVDPFAGGRVLDPPDLRALLKAGTGMAAELEPGHFAALDNRAILVRMQNDRKMRLLRAGEIGRALAVVEAVLLFAPGEAGLWREAGLMHMRLDNLPAAVASLEQFVARTGNGGARRRTQQLLLEIRSRMT